jgi:hypothetical protein
MKAKANFGDVKICFFTSQTNYLPLTGAQKELKVNVYCSGCSLITGN